MVTGMSICLHFVDAGIPSLLAQPSELLEHLIPILRSCRSHMPSFRQDTYIDNASDMQRFRRHDQTSIPKLKGAEESQSATKKPGVSGVSQAIVRSGVLQAPDSDELVLVKETLGIISNSAKDRRRTQHCLQASSVKVSDGRKQWMPLVLGG
jgi:hypothetical protein